MNKALLIIPAFNEEGSIGHLLDQLEASDVKSFADVLIINDASSDKTSQIVRNYPDFKLVTHVFNLGYGSALQLGYKYAVREGYDYVLQIDADGQHDVCNVRNLYEKLTVPDEGGKVPDIVIGSRFLENSQSFPIGGLKKVSIKLLRYYIRRTTGNVILDPTSGLHGLNRRAFLYYSIFQNFDYDYPDANMIIQMMLMGYNIVEIPSVMHSRTTGVSMHSGLWKPMLYMLTMPLRISAILVRIRQGKQRKISVW